MKKICMFGWKKIGAKWASEDANRALELLKENRIRCRMPFDDMFFVSAYHLLPGAVRRWQISVRRRDFKRAEMLLEREGLVKATRIDETEDSPASARLSIRPISVKQLAYAGNTFSFPPSYSAR